jgi:hypothetical protein
VFLTVTDKNDRTPHLSGPRQIMKNQSIHESVFEALKHSREYKPKARLPSQKMWPATQDQLAAEISIEEDASIARAEELLRFLMSHPDPSEDALRTKYLEKRATGWLLPILIVGSRKPN